MSTPQPSDTAGTQAPAKPPVYRVVIAESVLTEFEVAAITPEQAEDIAFSLYCKANGLQRLEPHIRPNQWLPDEAECVLCGTITRDVQP